MSARSHWGPVAGFAIVSSANQMAWLTFAPITTGAARYYGTSTSQVGLLSEIFPLVYVIGAIPAAKALQRNFRGSLAFGATLSAIGTVIRLEGPGPGGLAWVIAGQVLVAAAQPLLLNAVIALAQAYLVPQDRPTGIAIGSAGTFLGFVLAFVTSGLMGAGHIRGLLVLGAAYALIAAAVLGALLVVTPAMGEGAEGSGTAGMAELKALWADPVMRGLVYFVFAGFGVFVALVTWVQPLLAGSGVTASTADILLTAMMLAGVISSAVVPPLVAHRQQQLAFLVAAGVAAVASSLLLAIAPGRATAGIALVVTGLFLLPGMPVMLEVAERHSSTGAAAGTALIWLAGNAGGIVIAGVLGFAQSLPWLAFCLMALAILADVPTAAKLRGRLGGLAPRPSPGPIALDPEGALGRSLEN